MSSFKIEGGRCLSGSVTPSGNKNEALPVLTACLLTDKPITFRRIPKIGDVVTIISGIIREEIIRTVEALINAVTNI